MNEFGFIQNQNESDEAFNLKVLTQVFGIAVRDLFEQECDQCKYPDKFECLINPKCTIYCRASRQCNNGFDFHWKVAIYLKREDRQSKRSPQTPHFSLRGKPCSCGE